MDKKMLHDFVEKEEPNICQIVALKDGKEVYADEWNNYKKEDCVHVMSATKSIVSLLIGIAIDQGLINSIEDKVLLYFPEYKVKRGEKTIYDVTIRHLLTMTAPYKCKGDPWTKVCSSEDWTLTSLDILGGRKGITNEFRYQTVCLHILTGIISKVSKMTTVDFANKYLFEPIGVQKHCNYLAKTPEEHKRFIMNKAPVDNLWFCDPQGVGTAGYGLCFSAEDMAKIGLLCVNKDRANNVSVISSDWIDYMSTTTYLAGKEFRHMRYGYLWWINHYDIWRGYFSKIRYGGNSNQFYSLYNDCCIRNGFRYCNNNFLSIYGTSSNSFPRSAV